MLSKMPNRTDMLIPYLNYLLEVGKESMILSICNTQLRRKPNDPVALWFSGIVLLNDPNRQRVGYDRMRRSLQGGIRNLMPIPLKLIKILNE